MYWFIMVLKKYAVFSGRARRKEYWMFTFVYTVIAAIMDVFGKGLETGVFSIIYGIVLLLPSLAVSVRRLHDTERSGWWLLIGFVPVIGGIILLVFFCLNGTEGDNGYGTDPKKEIHNW